MSDKELDGLDQLAAAYRKLPRPEPSPALDAAILAQARAAVAKPMRRARWPAWVASAAAVTLAVGLAWRVRERTEMDQPDSPFATESAPAPAAGQAPANATGTDNSAGRLKDLPAGPQERQAQEADATRSDQGFAAEPAVQAPAVVPKPAPAQPAPGNEEFARKVVAPPADTRAQAPVDDLAKQYERRQREPRKLEAADAAEPGPETKSAAPPAAPPPPPALAPVLQEAPVVIDESLPMSEPAPPPEAFPRSAAAGAPAGDVSEEKLLTNEGKAKEDSPAGARRERAATTSASDDADRETGVQGETSTTTATGALGVTAGRDDARAEATAIEHIRQLLRDGRRNDAKRELARFRRSFPNATVPEDLRGLAR